MIEQIGKITLDYTHYSGKDLYCDGTVEDDLMAIVKNNGPGEYPRFIEETKSWPVFYHLSAQRENIVNWLPVDKSMKVLEIGSGCGAITGCLSRKAGSVTCVELSKKRSMINAYRNTECDNVTIHVGNFQEIEPDLPHNYDYVCLIGVFEYAQSYIKSDTPFEDFLNIIKKHVKADGRIVIAIENKYGLKYWAGCREDHLNTYFGSIEDYHGGGHVRTFSRGGLERILLACDVPEYHFYYPYPDYKFMTTLFSDEYQPSVGELSNNIRNYDAERLYLFNEKNVFDGIVREGLFPLYSNSFLVVIGKGYDLKYSKFSNDRAKEYAIRTDILIDRAARRLVRKSPLTPEAQYHIESIAVAYESLRERYDGSGLEINRCRMNADGSISLEYVEGVTLAELLDTCLEKNDARGFHELFRKYVEMIDYNNEMPVYDYDLIFSNILIDGDKWTVIDYEWTFGQQMETKAIAYRAAYCYLLENDRRKKMNLDLILQELGITQEEAENYKQVETGFQHFVTGDRKSMAEMIDVMGNEVVSVFEYIDKKRRMEKQLEEKENARALRERIRIYRDTGNGYNEEDAYYLNDVFENESLVKVNIRFGTDVLAVRVDPAEEPCMVNLREVELNGEPMKLDRKTFETNGFLMQGTDSYVFVSADPIFSFSLDGVATEEEDILDLEMEVVRLPREMAEDLARCAAKRRFHL